MLNFPPWKAFLSMIVIALSLFIVSYDFYNKYKNDSYSSGLKLGLDLQGGSSLVLEIDEDVFLDDYTSSLYENIKNILLAEEIPYYNFIKGKGSVSFSISEDTKLRELRQKVFLLDEFLDFANNNNAIVVTISEQSKNTRLRAIIENSIEIVRKRIDQSGTNEPVIKQQGSKQIIVELPGVENPEQIKRILGTTARLTFHLVDANATFGGVAIKPGYKYVQSSDNSGIRYAVKIMPEIYGKSLVNAKLEFQDQMPVVYFQFDTEGGKKFAKITTEQIGNMFAVVMDNSVISAPRINTPITGGAGIITGSFSVTEAQELALLLKAGSLPVPLSIVEERTVGPTLGADSIKSGIVAGICGYLIVFVFMIVFYKKLGMVANLSLIINVFFILALLSILGATLTLPGIAGIVLTMGMAVDANILVYERFAQESKANTSFPLAISNAFKRVFITIFDSNLTTLFTAIFLFSFGSGPIRGFAVTLIVGIISSMFAIMFVTRLFINVFLVKKNKKRVRV